MQNVSRQKLKGSCFQNKNKNRDLIQADTLSGSESCGNWVSLSGKWKRALIKSKVESWPDTLPENQGWDNMNRRGESFSMCSDNFFVMPLQTIVVIVIVTWTAIHIVFKTLLTQPGPGPLFCSNEFHGPTGIRTWVSWALVHQPTHYTSGSQSWAMQVFLDCNPRNLGWHKGWEQLHHTTLDISFSS